MKQMRGESRSLEQCAIQTKSASKNANVTRELAENGRNKQESLYFATLPLKPLSISPKGRRKR